jgi:YHS domain-containing protein
MTDTRELSARIEGLLTAVKDKARQNEQAALKAALERQARLAVYEQAQARVVELAKPRLEILAERAGERVTVTPKVTETRREVTFEFHSPKAYITLSFSVAPDQHVENVVVDCNLKIVPVLWKFDSHSEFRSPVTALDEPGLVRWLDDRIVGFVDLFIQIHEGELFARAENVTDPVAKITFPKFAAGATLERGGQTYYFIDASTRDRFAREHAVV